MEVEQWNFMVSLVSCIGALVSIAFACVSAWFARRCRAMSVRSHQDDLAQRFFPKFWDPLRKAYEVFRAGKLHLPNQLGDLIAKSGCPDKLSRHTDPIQYDIARAPDRQKHLWEFALAIYPPDTSGNRSVLDEKTIIAESDVSDFFYARSKLCGSFDTSTHDIGVHAMFKLYKGDYRLLCVLSYLDIAHRKWTAEENKGKPHLYDLVARMERKLRKQ